MLRITITESELEQRWILQGRLTGPWVAELEGNWNMRRAHDGRKCIVDLRDVTLIDACGEELLEAMSRAGAELTGSGVYVQYLAEEIACRWGRGRSARRKLK